VTAEEVSRAGARFDHRLLVRQEVPTRARDDTARLRANPACAAPKSLRNQIVINFAAWSRGSDRWSPGASKSYRALGDSLLKRHHPD
jgi:hypothetical protein